MTTSWHEGPLALFDVESSGVDPHRDRIVTAAVISVVPGCQPLTKTWLINPGIPIPEGAAAIHGITTEHATAHGMDPAQGVAEIAFELDRLTRLGHAIVGHNVPYDLTMLHAELLRWGRMDLAEPIRLIRPVIDTMVLDLWADPYRPKAPTTRRPDPARCGSRKLIDACRVYGVELSEADAHGAAADALAAGRLAWRIARAYPGCQMPARDAHDFLSAEKRRQADKFGAWLTSQGKTDDVSRAYPVALPPVGWTGSDLPVVRETEAVA